MKNQKSEYFPVMALRENLRQEASDVAGKLNRSVGRLTSCELEPYQEYDDEVAIQRQLAQRLFYLQNCRSALEHCLATGATAVRYRWPDGKVTVTHFRLVTPSRAKVTGFFREPQNPQTGKAQ